MILHVEFKKCSCRPVEFKKCSYPTSLRPKIPHVDFRGLGPYTTDKGAGREGRKESNFNKVPLHDSLESRDFTAYLSL